METPTPTRRSPAEPTSVEHCGKHFPLKPYLLLVDKTLKCFHNGEPNHLAVVAAKQESRTIVFDVKQQPTVNTIEEKLRAEVERKTLEGATTHHDDPDPPYCIGKRRRACAARS